MIIIVSWNPNTDSENIQSRYRNGIWQKKCAMLAMKSRKWHMTEGIELPNQEQIRTLGENETYKCLEILETDILKQVEMKGKILKECLMWTKSNSRQNYTARTLSKCDVAWIFISGQEFILCACDVGVVWHLTLRKINPSQDSCFAHMVLANNVGVDLGLDLSRRWWVGDRISLSHTPPSPSFSYPLG